MYLSSTPQNSWRNARAPRSLGGTAFASTRRLPLRAVSAPWEKRRLPVAAEGTRARCRSAASPARPTGAGRSSHAARTRSPG